MIFKGRVHKFGDNIDTDVIIPGRYLNSTSASELARHCMEDVDPDFSSKVQTGDIIVAMNNFGCGSSREHAPITIKALGVSCVVAVSFARIFYRNSINIGLPILECDGCGEIDNGDILCIDTDTGIIENQTSGKKYSSAPFPDFIRIIIDKGGLLASIE